ncbi:MAG: hypothetical protein QOD72_2751, partial [Acidimicrobiaceae bacterium]|nr:hypothetical protein [Acidimicrobiaceae bacterium]
MTTTDRFAVAGAVADAVLYEGYVLYPYRASAVKNQLRFQFGVLTPPWVSHADPSERSSMRTECLVDPGAAPRLAVRVRFLHLQHRVGAGAPWDEAVERQVDLGDIALLPFVEATRDVMFNFVAGEDACDGVVRRREHVEGVVRVRAAWAPGPAALIKVTVTVENTSPHGLGANRSDAMRWSLVAVHTALAVDDGAFVSLLDPPEHAVEA